MTATFPYFDIRQFAADQDVIGMFARPNSTGMTQGYFCTKCGSRLVHVHVAAEDGREGVKPKNPKTLSVKAGCLEGLSKAMMRTAVHIWTKSAVIDIPVSAEQYEEEPPNGSL
jgi:hypothetical protein